MKEIDNVDNGVLNIQNYTCNSSTPLLFEGDEHEFHNPQLHEPATLQIVLYGYVLPILVIIRYVILLNFYF